MPILGSGVVTSDGYAALDSFFVVGVFGFAFLLFVLCCALIYSKKTSPINAILISSFATLCLVIAGLASALSMSLYSFIDTILPLFIFCFGNFVVYRVLFSNNHELF